MSLAAFSLVRRVPAVNVRRLGITPVALAVALTSVPLGALTFQVLRSSYFEYLSNGPGGVGQHVLCIGWCQVIVLRFGLWAFGVKDQDLTIYKKLIAAGETRKWLSDDLPQRDGLRPALKLFPLPQRQLVDQQDELLGAAQLAILSKLAEEHSTKVLLQNSVLEGFGPGLFVHPTVDPCALTANHRREFAHIHLAPYSFQTTLHKLTAVRVSMSSVPEAKPDAPYHAEPLPGPQSMHVTLAPKDAILVIEKGWGVRHPASGEPPMGVPRLAAGYILTYAPRNGDELEVLKQIVEASAAFVASTKDLLV